MEQKRGISPVIATVLLVAMVVVIGLIIFLWFRGFIDEAITKNGGTNIELVCGDVTLQADYSYGILSISNPGNVPIYGMKVKISKDRGYDTSDLPGFDGLAQGQAYSESFDAGSATSLTLIPVLLGTSEEGEKTYICDEKQHGYEILVKS